MQPGEDGVLRVDLTAEVNPAGVVHPGVYALYDFQVRVRGLHLFWLVKIPSFYGLHQQCIVSNSRSCSTIKRSLFHANLVYSVMKLCRVLQGSPSKKEVRSKRQFTLKARKEGKSRTPSLSRSFLEGRIMRLSSSSRFSAQKLSTSTSFRQQHQQKLCRLKTEYLQFSKLDIGQEQEVPQVDAGNWVVFDLNRRLVLGQKLSYQNKEVASLTKLMTSLVCNLVLVERDLPLTLKVNATEAACAQEGSTAELLPRGIYSLECLLYGMLLPSGNDAAYLLSEYCGRVLYLSRRRSSSVGTWRVDLHEEEKSGLTKIYLRQFMARMNEEAKRLRMSHTNFRNPTGLPDPNSRSNCSDLVKLCSRVLATPTLKRICQSRHYYFHYSNDQGQAIVASFHNTNSLLGGDCKGLKTGMTTSAGGCFAAYWERQDLRMLVIVLGCKDQTGRFQQAKKLYKYYYQQK